MKYEKLLRYLIEWGKEDFYLKSIFDEERHNNDLKEKNIPDELKKEMIEARKEYIEYIGGEDMQKKHCIGCYDNFYNCGDKTCWSFDKAKKLVTKFYIDNETPMSQKSGYTKKNVPPCYKKQGGVLLNEIPNYAK
jgi:hypothetical protein